jgi:acyl carrier protein
LRLLLTGAETLHTFPRAGLPFAVVNNYGPTECAVVATSGIVPSESNQTTTLPTIGRPIANVQVHVLDEQGKPAQDGESGEIYIGGAGVARGYRNRPGLTAKRFLPDPFSAGENARMYRTGDLGRTLPDGQIVFEGRVDNQEKIRGYRIEPDEIASALNRHPAVSSSVVAGDGAAGERRLVAYFVAAGAEPVMADDLREFLSQSLPEHMVPSMFIRLDALPQTSQGKLDRAALPKPTAGTALGGLDYRAAATPTERRIAAVIAKVLGTDQIGADDNFFLLGGHSLLGTQVVIQVRQAFGIELTLRHLFNAPTVASLATTVEGLVLQKVQSMTDEEARSQAERLSVIG